MASCVAGAVGADTFNVYIVVSSTDKNVVESNLVSGKEYEGKCEYLVKFENKKSINTEINGPTEINNAIELENLKYIYIFQFHFF